jgi:uncharacterized membrane protein
MRKYKLDSKIIYFIKSLIYRVYSSIITFAISYLITGKVSIGLFIGFSDFTIKIFTYYFYEYIWNKTKLSKLKENGG